MRKFWNIIKCRKCLWAFLTCSVCRNEMLNRDRVEQHDYKLDLAIKQRMALEDRMKHQPKPGDDHEHY